MPIDLIGGQICCDIGLNGQIPSRFGSLDCRAKQACRKLLASKLRQNEELDNASMRIGPANSYMASINRSLDMILQH